jgi:hypoxanthine phosphoribosyltransferase
MYYRNITDLNNILLKRLSILPKDIDLIVGVPRSGMLPANLLALYLNKPYTDIHSFLNGHIYKAGARSQFFTNKDYKKILVVDDSIASGSAMDKCRQDMQPYAHDFDIQYCAVYVIPGKEKAVDYYFEVVPLPRYFQWNVFNHTSLEKACFDIDGVLCEDPTSEQNDDGPKYVPVRYLSQAVKLEPLLPQGLKNTGPKQKHGLISTMCGMKNSSCSTCRICMQGKRPITMRVTRRRHTAKPVVCCLWKVIAVRQLPSTGLRVSLCCVPKHLK